MIDFTRDPSIKWRISNWYKMNRETTPREQTTFWAWGLLHYQNIRQRFLTFCFSKTKSQEYLHYWHWMKDCKVWLWRELCCGLSSSQSSLSFGGEGESGRKSIFDCPWKKFEGLRNPTSSQTKSTSSQWRKRFSQRSAKVYLLIWFVPQSYIQCANKLTQLPYLKEEPKRWRKSRRLRRSQLRLPQTQSRSAKVAITSLQ